MFVVTFNKISLYKASTYGSINRISSYLFKLVTVEPKRLGGQCFHLVFVTAVEQLREDFILISFLICLINLLHIRSICQKATNTHETDVSLGRFYIHAVHQFMLIFQMFESLRINKESVKHNINVLIVLSWHNVNKPSRLNVDCDGLSL